MTLITASSATNAIALPPNQLKSLGAAPCASSTAACKMIVSEYGTELTSNAVLAWCGESDAFGVCEGELPNRRFALFGAGDETVSGNSEALWISIRSIWPYLRHERPVRPLLKAKASRSETGSTFCSRGPNRQLAHRL